MSWTVIAHPAVEEWFATLDTGTLQQVAAAVDLLKDDGPALGRPIADTVKGSRHKNMKELRPGSSGRSEVRIMFAFDLARQAILLVAGDKAGQWEDWYKQAIPLADDRYDEHLRRLREQEQGWTGSSSSSGGRGGKSAPKRSPRDGSTKRR